MTISLPVHPFTGLTALGLRRDGQPIWPVAGGSEPPEPQADPVADPKPDEPLGEAGLKALQAERDAKAAAQKELAEYKAGLIAAIGGKPAGGKTAIETLQEQMAEQRTLIEAQNLSLLRRDVADGKKLTAGQAALLVGATKEELEAHADKLIAEFGGAKKDDGDGDLKPGVKKGLKPDPAQGTGGGAKPSAADAGRAEAAKRFGTKTAATT